MEDSNNKMFTRYTREDLEEIIQGNHDLYNMFSLIGDKLRVIYVALGWTHMTKDFFRADEVVEEMTQHVLEALLSDEEDVSWGTAGLNVRGYWEEDNLMLDYSFNL